MSDHKCLSNFGYANETPLRGEPKGLLEVMRGETGGKGGHTLLLIAGLNAGSTPERTALITKLLEGVSCTELIPAEILLLDKAVELACADREALGSLCRMEAMGTQIGVCRSSAEQYECKDKLCCGELCGIEEIWSRLAAADKVISL